MTDDEREDEVKGGTKLLTSVTFFNNHQLLPQARARVATAHLPHIDSFAQRKALIPYAAIICSSIMISHTLTYILLGDGLGAELNPGAFLTVWIPPPLNLALWEGGMVCFFSFEWNYFERNRVMIIALTLTMVFLFAIDALNDIVVSIEVGSI